MNAERPDVLVAILPPFGPEGPPLGLACVAAALREAGYAVRAADYNIRLFRAHEKELGHLWSPAQKAAWVWPSRQAETIAAFGGAFDDIATEIADAAPRIAGFSVHSDNLGITIETISRLRERLPGVKVIVGGLGVFSEQGRKAFPRRLVDAFVVGEGERTVVDLVGALLTGQDVSQLAGVAVPGGTCRERSPALSLDDFPLPTFEDFDLALYSTPNLPVAFTRGCTKGCTMCNDRVLMGRFRARKAERVFAEIKEHVERLGVRDFMIVDLQITQYIDEVMRLAQMILDAGLDIRWNANAAVGEALTPEVLQTLRRAGCHTLTLGVESGSDHILRLMNKRSTAQAAANTMQAIKDAGMICWVNLVIGFPGEQEEHLDETLAWLEANASRIDEVAVLNACNILDHSILAERPEKFGIQTPLTPPWSEVSWIGTDGNTPAVRQRRLARVKETLDRLGLPVRQTNLGFVDEAHFMDEQGHDLLVVMCPPHQVDYLPYDLSVLVSYLSDRGFRVLGLDLNVDEFARADDGNRRWWELGRRDVWADPDSCTALLERLAISPARLAEQVVARHGRMIYFHLERHNLEVTRRVMQAVRERDPKATLVIGGDATRIDEERQLFPAAICDLAVIGDPEETLDELLRRQRDGRDWLRLRGSRWVDADGEPRYLPREPLRDLDALGYPTHRQFWPERYQSDALPIRLSRGCTYRCAFCGEQPAKGGLRTRDPAVVVAEMMHHYNMWNISTFHFTDLVIDGDLAALEELCDRLIRSGVAFTWTAQIAPRADLSPALFAKMAAAGCHVLRFGVESFSDALLRHMNKTYDGQTAIANLRDAHQAGLETHLNLIVGFPGETDADLLATIRGLADAKDFIDCVDEVTPCQVLHDSVVQRECTEYVVLLPAEDQSRQWSHRAYNNPAWRHKRAAELSIWIAGLGIKFNYDYYVPPTHPFRKIETQIRARLAEKIKPPVEVVLVTMPPWGFENPPVGLAYLSTYLRANGFHTAVRDYNIRFYHGVHAIYRMLWHVENKNFWSNDDTFAVVQYAVQGLIDEAVDELVRLSPPVLGFSVVDPKERVTLEVIRRFREHNKTTRIILGGPACFTPEYRQIFIDRAGDLIDGYCIGEGEETLLEAARRVRAAEPWRDLPGLMVLDENRECRYTPRPPLMDLDRVPPPTYDEFDHGLYPGDSLILEWSRGCIGNCTYCKGRQISGRFRMRSAAHIFGELQRHVEKHGYHSFTISDNLLNGDPQILGELCDRIIAAGLAIRWNGEAIPLPGMSRRLLDKMAQAGCYEIQWGIESASPNVLRRMGKGRYFTVEQARQVIRDSHEAGIKTCLFLIVGFPGEEPEDFAQTLAFVRANAAWIDQVKSINSMHVITGTAIHEHPDRFGIVLPERDYHYLWQSADGRNTPAERNRRIREMLTLCQACGIEVRETNLTEGKQEAVASRIKDPQLSLDERMKLLIDAINDLRSFEIATVEAGDRAGPLACGYEMPEEAEPLALSTAETEAFVGDNLALAGVLDGIRVYAGPEVLEIDLTNFCNLDCVGCWNHSPLLRDKRFTGEEKQRRLPTDLVLKLIDDAARLGAKQVQLSGAGDPLCHPDALAIIERIKSHGLECTVITNGTLLTEAICRRLVELGVDHLTVSVWAGTPAVYAAIHPNQTPKTLDKIKQSLQLIHELKARRRVFAPTVKVYHVVCHLNAADIGPMVTFAVDALAEHLEFTPIDVVPGYTDELALTDDDRAAIVRQLHDLPKREDYLELDPTRGAKRADADGEGLEFARFVKKSLLPKGFRYELDDITRFDVLCPRKEWRLDVQEDNKLENALLFFYPQHECENCPNNPTCAIDKERYAVKVEFTSFLGYGAFLRRIRSRATTGYDADKIDEVPCCIGWTYARVKTDGSVIPCCKADRMPMGNLLERPFAEVWQGVDYATFRRTALTTSKHDAYFAPIACALACDNLGHNLATQERLQKLTEAQRALLTNLRKGRLPAG
jgi:radical SAM superfamily enzyme YgiQ (UPF0313 family)/uncharacterized Fe-S cluster-containing radical SAM superfamily protein